MTCHLSLAHTPPGFPLPPPTSLCRYFSQLLWLFSCSPSPDPLAHLIDRAAEITWKDRERRGIIFSWDFFFSYIGCDWTRLGLNFDNRLLSGNFPPEFCLLTQYYCYWLACNVLRMWARCYTSVSPKVTEDICLLVAETCVHKKRCETGSSRVQIPVWSQYSFRKSSAYLRLRDQGVQIHLTWWMKAKYKSEMALDLFTYLFTSINWSSLYPCFLLIMCLCPII